MKDPFEFEDYLVHLIREHDPSEYAEDPFDLYLPKIIRLYMEDKGLEGYSESPTPYLMDAAWALCLRGILRPGASQVGIGIMKSRDGYTGQGFGITKWGKRWVEEEGSEPYIPSEPETLTELFKTHAELLGEAYIIRSKDAVRCLFTHAYYACCAMCGAAVEAIVYRLSIESIGEELTVKIMQNRGGFHKIVKQLSLGKPMPVANPFLRYIDPVKYWRDSASHGKQIGITRDEAFLAMLGLAAFARFSAENWLVLTSNNQTSNT